MSGRQVETTADIHPQQRTVEVILFPYSSAIPEVCDAVVHEEIDGGVKTEGLNLDLLFPNGFLSVLFTTIPNTSFALPHIYRIYVDNFSEEMPINLCVESTFGSMWVGNVVVAKYAKSNSYADETFANVQRQETDLLVVLVGM
jgi:hypothetical protein